MAYTEKKNNGKKDEGRGYEIILKALYYQRNEHSKADGGENIVYGEKEKQIQRNRKNVKKNL